CPRLPPPILPLSSATRCVPHCFSGANTFLTSPLPMPGLQTSELPPLSAWLVLIDAAPTTSAGNENLYGFLPLTLLSSPTRTLHFLQKCDAGKVSHLCAERSLHVTYIAMQPIAALFDVYPAVESSNSRSSPGWLQVGLISALAPTKMCS